MAARPIWNGTLSFGLLNIPIQLMTGEKRNELHFRQMDQRNKAPIKYERVNAETGEEVPWKEIVKAYEYSKGHYVVLEPEDLAEAASENREVIDIEAFVDRESIGPQYLEKPYVLVPGKKAEKGYVLLREVLKKTGKVGIGRVMVRTKEYLGMVVPEHDALMLIILRFPEEIVPVEDYNIPEGTASKWHVTPKEMEMATTLLESMATEFKPEDYKDEFKERLSAAIKKRMKQKGATTEVAEEESAAPEATTNVVAFMSLLKKSLEKKGDTPKKTATARKAAKKPATKKAPAKTTTKSKKSA